MTTITIANGNLFQVAATELGDAMQWINIAITNSIKDPFIDQLSELSIPSYQSVFSDGIGPQ